MYYNYYYDFDDLFNLPFSHSAAGVLGAFAVLFILVYLLILAYGILSYVLTSLGFYTMAKRRGIRNYGLAWVPVANMWIIGSLADQYDLAIKGRETGYRRKLLTTSIISAAGALLLFIAAFAGGIIAALSQDSSAAGGAAAVGALVLFLVLLVLEILLYVFYYISLHKVFMSCNPGTATTFLVLAIVINATLPFFVFADRNKDLGFPLPRPKSRPCRPLQPLLNRPSPTNRQTTRRKLRNPLRSRKRRPNPAPPHLRKTPANQMTATRPTHNQPAQSKPSHASACGGFSFCLRSAGASIF